MITQGQWESFEDPTSPGYFLVKSGEINICIMQERDSDMGMDTDPTREECEANARLIAMAPAMLKFIQQTRNWVSDMGHQPMTDACDDILREVK